MAPELESTTAGSQRPLQPFGSQGSRHHSLPSLESHQFSPQSIFHGLHFLLSFSHSHVGGKGLFDVPLGCLHEGGKTFLSWPPILIDDDEKPLAAPTNPTRTSDKRSRFILIVVSKVNFERMKHLIKTSFKVNSTLDKVSNLLSSY